MVTDMLQAGIALLREAISIDSSFVLGYTRLAYLRAINFHSTGLEAVGRSSISDRAGRRAFRRTPEVLWTKGAFHSLVSNKPRLARDFYHSAGAAGLEGRRLYVALAVIARRLREWDEALMYRRLFADLEPFSGATFSLGRVRRENGELRLNKD